MGILQVERSPPFGIRVVLPDEAVVIDGSRLRIARWSPSARTANGVDDIGGVWTFGGTIMLQRASSASFRNSLTVLLYRFCALCNPYLRRIVGPCPSCAKESLNAVLLEYGAVLYDDTARGLGLHTLEF